MVEKPLNAENQEYLLLPEYQATRQYLISQGRPWEWILKTVDIHSSGACFLKKGKPCYQSECPFYEGFWLDGGTGSVQCSASDMLLPSLHHHHFCRTPEGCEKCPQRKSNTGG